MSGRCYSRLFASRRPKTIAQALAELPDPLRNALENPVQRGILRVLGAAGGPVALDALFEALGVPAEKIADELLVLEQTGIVTLQALLPGISVREYSSRYSHDPVVEREVIELLEQTRRSDRAAGLGAK